MMLWNSRLVAAGRGKTLMQESLVLYGVVFLLLYAAIDMCMKVAMGQGQAEVAMQLLQDCATNGEWLCLKNLHLVTAWLPTLEKVTR